MSVVQPSNAQRLQTANKGAPRQTKEGVWQSVSNDVHQPGRSSETKPRNETLPDSAFQPQYIYFRKLFEEFDPSRPHSRTEATKPAHPEEPKPKARTVFQKAAPEPRAEAHTRSSNASLIRTAPSPQHSETRVSATPHESDRPSKPGQRSTSQHVVLDKFTKPRPIQALYKDHDPHETRTMTLRDSRDSRSRDDESFRRSEAHPQLRESKVERSLRSSKAQPPTYDSFDPRDSVDQTHHLIQKSRELQGYIDDYISLLKSDNPRTKEGHSARPSQPHSVRGTPDHPGKPRATPFARHEDPHIVVEHRGSLDHEGRHAHPTVRSGPLHSQTPHRTAHLPVNEDQLRAKIHEVYEHEKGKLGAKVLERVKEKIHEDSLQNKSLLDEFYDFCDRQLPKDHNFKDSMLLVSMFYYFLEKKNLINK